MRLFFLYQNLQILIILIFNRLLIFNNKLNETIFNWCCHKNMGKTMWVIVITGVIVLAGCTGHRSPAAVTAATVGVYTDTFTPTETYINTNTPINTACPQIRLHILIRLLIPVLYAYIYCNVHVYNTFIPSYTFTPTATSTNIGAMPRISGYFSFMYGCSTDNVCKVVRFSCIRLESQQLTV